MKKFTLYDESKTSVASDSTRIVSGKNARIREHLAAQRLYDALLAMYFLRDNRRGTKRYRRAVDAAEEAMKLYEDILEEMYGQEKRPNRCLF